MDSKPHQNYYNEDDCNSNKLEELRRKQTTCIRQLEELLEEPRRASSQPCCRSISGFERERDRQTGRETQTDKWTDCDRTDALGRTHRERRTGRQKCALACLAVSHITSRRVASHLVWSHRVTPRHITSRHATPRHATCAHAVLGAGRDKVVIVVSCVCGLMFVCVCVRCCVICVARSWKG